jgi:predicted PurR-regulated permease PerM
VLSLVIAVLGYFLKQQIEQIKELIKHVNKMGEIQVAHTTRLDNMDHRFSANEHRLNEQSERLRGIELSHAACNKNKL